MRTSAIALTVVAFFGLTTSLHASTISENFNELTPQLDVTSAGAFSTINGTNVDIVGGSLFGNLCVSPASGNCIDMDGTNGNPQGQLQSNQSFAAGTYLLSFDLLGDQRGSTSSTTVTFGNNYDQTFTLSSNDDTDGIVLNDLVTLTSPGYLLFTSDTPGDAGNILDNVVVATTPEPSAILLLGTGLLAAAGAMRKRFA
jgi:hypothetical protein